MKLYLGKWSYIRAHFNCLSICYAWLLDSPLIMLLCDIHWLPHVSLSQITNHSLVREVSVLMSFRSFLWDVETFRHHFSSSSCSWNCIKNSRHSFLSLAWKDLTRRSASCLIKSTTITFQEDDAEISDDEETDLLLILHDDDDVFLLHPTQNFKLLNENYSTRVAKTDVGERNSKFHSLSSLTAYHL